MIDISTPGVDWRDDVPWHSHRLWSLWDMMNFSLFEFVTARMLVSREVSAAMDRFHADRTSQIAAADKERLVANLGVVARLCKKMLLNNTDNRLARTYGALNGSPTYGEIANNLSTLFDALEDDIKTERFFHYRRDKGLLILMIPSDWRQTIAAFPSAQSEIEDGVDCYATDHPTAAVFHFMRVAELGLRALAKERKIRLPKDKPLEWGTWQDLIKGIKDASDVIGKTKPAGRVKDDALSFYNGAVAHFEAFKDQYRNMVMHVRKRYEEPEAQMALTHVRDFMNGLSAKVGEVTKGQIKWKF